MILAACALSGVVLPIPDRGVDACSCAGARHRSLARAARRQGAGASSGCARSGIPVPPAFVLTTDVCARFYDAGGTVPADVLAALPDAMAAAGGRRPGARFGGGRAAAAGLGALRARAISMPGMMDTVLNLGMTDDGRGARWRRGRATRRSPPTPAAGSWSSSPRSSARRRAGRPVGAAARRRSARCSAPGTRERAIAYRSDRGHPRRRRHRGHRAGDGVRQPRRPLGHRRAVQPQPADRATPSRYGEWLPRGQGEDVVSGPVRPAAAGGAGRARCPSAHAELMTPPRRWSATAATCRTSSSPSRPGSCGCCRPARPSARRRRRSGSPSLLAARGPDRPRDEALDRVTAEQVDALLQAADRPGRARRRRAAGARASRPARGSPAASW